MQSIRNFYRFCSICGGRLKKSGSNLSCTRCSFVNYRNPRPTVTALIIYKGELLLSKRNNKPFKGQWDLPGGFVDKGESPEDAIRRELYEEMGLRVNIKKLFGVYKGIYPHKIDPCYVLSIIYLVEPQNKKIRVVDLEELQDLRWFSKNELKSIKVAFDSNRRVLKDFFKTWPSNTTLTGQ